MLNNSITLPASAASSASFLPIGGSRVCAETAVLGALVQRGPHFEYGNEQDGGDGKTGTLLNIIRRIPNNNSNNNSSPQQNNQQNNNNNLLLAKVKWSETGVVGLYRMGPDHFDLIFSEIMIPPHLDGMPVDVGNGGAFLGAVVSRNPEFWCWGDQDGPKGGHIIKVENETGWVVVKWGDDSVFKYRAGGKGHGGGGAGNSTEKPVCDLLYGERWCKKLHQTPVYTHELNILNKSDNSNTNLDDQHFDELASSPSKSNKSSAHNSLLNPPSAKSTFNEEEGGPPKAVFRTKTPTKNTITSSVHHSLNYDHQNNHSSHTTPQTSGNLLAALASQNNNNNSKNNTPSPTRTLPKEADPVSIENFRPGARVIRGPNWRTAIYGNQDLDFGGWGILRSCDAKEQFVRVKWASGVKRNYRAGIDQAYDLQYDANPLSPIRVTTTNQSIPTPAAPLIPTSSSTNRYNFSAAPANVILAYNESRRKELKKFIEFNIQERRRRRKLELEQQRRGMPVRVDQGELDDDDAFDVTSTVTVMTNPGTDDNNNECYTELFSFYGFTDRKSSRSDLKGAAAAATGSKNKNNGKKPSIWDNLSNSDDDKRRSDESFRISRESDRQRQQEQQEKQKPASTTKKQSAFTPLDPSKLLGAGQQHQHHRLVVSPNGNDDDDTISSATNSKLPDDGDNFDDDEDLSSVVSNFTCFNRRTGNEQIPKSNNKNRNQPLMMREVEVFNEDRDADNMLQEHDIMSHVSVNNNNNNNQQYSNLLNQLAAPPPRPLPVSSSVPNNINNNNSKDVSDLCLQCKQRVKIYGNVPCGHVTLCPVCVAGEMLKLEMAMMVDNRDSSKNNNHQHESASYCLVCKKPVEMMIKIFK